MKVKSTSMILKSYQENLGLCKNHESLGKKYVIIQLVDLPDPMYWDLRLLQLFHQNSVLSPKTLKCNIISHMVFLHFFHRNQIFNLNCDKFRIFPKLRPR